VVVCAISLMNKPSRFKYTVYVFVILSFGRMMTWWKNIVKIISMNLMKNRRKRIGK